MGIRSFKTKRLSEVLEELETSKNDAKMVAGGTDILIELRNKKIDPKVIIDISEVEELRNIAEDGEYITIGSAVRYVELIESKLFTKNMKGIIDSARYVGSPQIRSLGTIGGNICNGSPAADMIPPLLALDAVLKIESKGKSREIRLENLFLEDGGIDLKDNEILTEIKFKKLAENEVLTFSKLGLRKALAISRISIAAYLKVVDGMVEDVRIASGALGRYGMREKDTEDKIKGGALNEGTVNKGVESMAEVLEKRLEGRSSLEFKGEAVKGIIRDVLVQGKDFFSEGV